MYFPNFLVQILHNTAHIQHTTHTIHKHTQHTIPTIHTHHITSHHITFCTCLVVILVVMASVSGQAVVVGGGLAGMSAANTILENGGRVVLLDKSFCCGGNSTKATSGINGANTRTQREKGIKDSADLFTSDPLKGGAKKPKLVKVLCENSGADVEWLMDRFYLDLSLVARLGVTQLPALTVISVSAGTSFVILGYGGE